jgi:peptidoglycan hydrolase CwlO-like protein
VEFCLHILNKRLKKTDSPGKNVAQLQNELSKAEKEITDTGHAVGGLTNTLSKRVKDIVIDEMPNPIHNWALLK